MEEKELNAVGMSELDVDDVVVLRAFAAALSRLNDKQLYQLYKLMWPEKKLSGDMGKKYIKTVINSTIAIANTLMEDLPPEAQEYLKNRGWRKES